MINIGAEPAGLKAAAGEQPNLEGIFSENANHELALYIGEQDQLYYAVCSCLGFHASRHTDRDRLEQLHTDHVDRSKSRSE